MSRLGSASPTFASPTLIICVAVRMCAVNKWRWCSRVMRPSPEFVFFLHLMRRNQAVSHERPEWLSIAGLSKNETLEVYVQSSATLPKKKKRMSFFFFFSPKLFLKTKSVLHLGWDNIWEWGANYHTPFDLCFMQHPNFIWIGAGLVRCRFFCSVPCSASKPGWIRGNRHEKTRGD